MSAPDEVTIARATVGDLPKLLDFMRRLRAEDPGLCETPDDPAAMRIAAEQLLQDASLGQIWMASLGGDLAGYAAVVFSYSIELGGRIAFVDELYVSADFRRRGLGGRLLAFAELEGARLGVTTMLLEVSRHNPAATELYRKAGFVERPYQLMQRKLTIDD